MEKPTLPKGTRDFGPAVMARRQFILNTIKGVFQKYGFQQLETPAMENLTTLTGKYGEEGDQLLFKVLDSGEFYEKFLATSKSEFNNLFMRGLQQVLKKLCFLIFNELEDHETRQFGKIKSIIESKDLDLLLIGIHMDHWNRELLKKFIREESVITSLNLVDFFIKASLHKENYKEELENQFERLIDNVLISGYSKILENFLFQNLESKKVVRNISEKGLKYDLTVPFARYVVMNRHEVTFPFKRFQIQPVWRADRPQKGRYREFYQCDADVIGTDSLLCEAEIVLMIREVCKGLGIEDFSIKVNHRGILTGLAEIAEAKGNESSLFVAIDKLDKIGEEKVKEELSSKGFKDGSIERIFDIINFKGSNLEKIESLKNRLEHSGKGTKGVQDIKRIIELLSKFDLAAETIDFDIALARGLSYYTGAIFEVKINNVGIGSVGGGGRYDNLTGIFGLEGVSGVGFSFGVDRLYDAMDELNLFPEDTEESSKVLIVHFDEKAMIYGLRALKELRREGVAAEIYPDNTKLKKQLDYANKKKIPFVIVIGSDEMKSGTLTFKNMKTGEQQPLTLDEILIQF